MSVSLNNQPTWREIAKRLGVTEATFHGWRKNLEDAPKSRDIDEWVAYRDARGLAKGQSKDLKELKVLIAEEDLKKKRRENEIGEGNLIPVDDVRDFLTALAAKFDQLLTQKIDTEIPSRLLGKDIVASRAEAALVHDEIREVVNAGINRWKPEPR